MNLRTKLPQNIQWVNSQSGLKTRQWATWENCFCKQLPIYLNMLITVQFCWSLCLLNLYHIHQIKIWHNWPFHVNELENCVIIFPISSYMELDTYLLQDTSVLKCSWEDKSVLTYPSEDVSDNPSIRPLVHPVFYGKSKMFKNDTNWLIHKHVI